MAGLGMIEISLFLVFGIGGGLGLPFGMPPGPEDPLMSRVAPNECIFYTTWSPTVAPDATKNPSEAWMAQPSIGGSVDKLKAAISNVIDRQEGDEREMGRIGFQIAELSLQNSVAVYLKKFQIDVDTGTVQAEGGFLFDLGDHANDINQRFNDLMQRQIDRESAAGFETDFKFERFELDGITFRAVRFPEADMVIAWGVVRDKYLAVGLGEGEIERMIANLETPPPAWLDQVRERIPVPRVASVTFADVKRLISTADQIPEPELLEFIELSGLKQIESIGWITGLDEQGFVMRSDIIIDGKPSGVLGLIDGDPLKPAEIGKISNDRMITFATRLSLPKTYEYLNELTSFFLPPATSLEEQVQELNRLADFDFEEEMLGRMDDLVYGYGSISITNPASGWLLALGAGDEMALSEPYDKIVELIRQSTEDVPSYELEESKVGVETIYTYSDTRGFGLPNPSWTFASGELLFSLDKTSLRRHLRRESGADDSMINDPWYRSMFQPIEPGGAGPVMVTSVDWAQILKLLLPLLSTFGSEMLFGDEFDFSFDDLPDIDVLTNNVKPSVSAVYRTADGFQVLQRQTYPGGSPGALAGSALVLGTPATVSVRRASARTTSTNNIRQVVLAMHNYHDSYRGLPARYSKDADDKPLLSWRVHILPFLEQQDLYDEFHLDEPWDSDHNKQLIERMPDVFKHPRIRLEDGKTVYVVADGADSPMAEPEDSHDDSEQPTGVKFREIRDGTSTTALVLEVNQDHAVTWTKPDDYKWEDQAEILDGLTGVWPGLVLLGLCDGSVHALPEDRLADKIKLLLQKNDGEVVDLFDR